MYSSIGQLECWTIIPQLQVTALCPGICWFWLNLEPHSRISSLQMAVVWTFTNRTWTPTSSVLNHEWRKIRKGLTQDLFKRSRKNYLEISWSLWLKLNPGLLVLFQIFFKTITALIIHHYLHISLNHRHKCFIVEEGARCRRSNFNDLMFDFKEFVAVGENLLYITYFFCAKFQHSNWFY